MAFAEAVIGWTLGEEKGEALNAAKTSAALSRDRHVSAAVAGLVLGQEDQRRPLELDVVLAERSLARSGARWGAWGAAR